jgi:hypothetical protein
MVPFIGAAQEFVNYAIDPRLSKACLQQICSKQNLFSFSRDTVLQIKSAFYYYTTQPYVQDAFVNITPLNS